MERDGLAFLDCQQSIRIRAPAHHQVKLPVIWIRTQPEANGMKRLIFRVAPARYCMMEGRAAGEFVNVTVIAQMGTLLLSIFLVLRKRGDRCGRLAELTISKSMG